MTEKPKPTKAQEKQQHIAQLVKETTLIPASAKAVMLQWTELLGHKYGAIMTKCMEAVKEKLGMDAEPKEYDIEFMNQLNAEIQELTEIRQKMKQPKIIKATQMPKIQTIGRVD